MDKDGNKYYPESNELLLTEYSYTFSKKNAGDAGYFTYKVTIPAKYKIASISVATGQIADSGGLQVTPIYGLGFTQGVETIYFNYFSPKKMTIDLSLSIYILYIKT